MGDRSPRCPWSCLSRESLLLPSIPPFHPKPTHTVHPLTPCDSVCKDHCSPRASSFPLGWAGTQPAARRLPPVQPVGSARHWDPHPLPRKKSYQWKQRLCREGTGLSVASRWHRHPHRPAQGNQAKLPFFYFFFFKCRWAQSWKALDG